jgi:hypothetical protein
MTTQATKEENALKLAHDRLQWARDLIQNTEAMRPYRRVVGSFVFTFVFPGIVRVCDKVSGELLAESAPGQPLVLAEGFVPPIPPEGW